jgi:hypothetical protein
VTLLMFAAASAYGTALGCSDLMLGNPLSEGA